MRYLICCVYLLVLGANFCSADQFQSSVKDEFERAFKEAGLSIKDIPTDLFAECNERLFSLKGGNAIEAIQKREFAEYEIPEPVLKLNPSFIMISENHVSLDYMIIPHTCFSIILAKKDSWVEEEVESGRKQSDFRFRVEKLHPNVWLAISDQYK